jgi:glutamine synthetase
MNRLAEYIWLDGAETQGLRSKARVVEIPEHRALKPADFPTWGYDGSSTYQADGGDSDLGLVPVRVFADPLRGDGSYLVLCEVFDSAGSPHSTNRRAELRRLMAEGGSEQEPTIGFEQEYTLYRDGRPLGFPEHGFPGPQGPYYCGVGAGRAYGRPVVEEHTRACLEAGLMIYGINAEVMPGQWEFQVGYRGFAGESADPLAVADHLLVARYLLERVAERHEVEVSWDPKPMKGDWNGAGAHTNFSTRAMRDPRGGRAAIEAAIERLAKRHQVHITAYGAGLAERLTGLHETCSIDQFRGGVADRGASIRVPRHVEEKGYGYLEDRRPGANCDPYRVGSVLLETICAAGAPRATQPMAQPVAKAA